MAFLMGQPDHTQPTLDKSRLLADLWQLAERLPSDHPYRQLLVGKVPTRLPFIRRLAPGDKLIGSRIVAWDPLRPAVDVFMLTRGEPVDVLAAYQSLLLGQFGWQLMGGPQPAPSATDGVRSGTLYRRDALWELSLAVVPQQSGWSAARLRYHCGHFGGWLMDCSMALSAPPGLDLGDGWSGMTGGDLGWRGETTIQTELTPHEVVAKFDAQLTQAGWTVDARQSDRALAASAWSYPQSPLGEARQTLLMAYAGAQDGQLIVEKRFCFGIELDEPAVQVATADPTTLRTLAELLMLPAFRTGDPTFPVFPCPGETRLQLAALQPGQLSAEWPAQLPPFERSRVIGSATYRFCWEENHRIGDGIRIEAMLAVPGRPGAVRSAYTRALTQHGWEIAPARQSTNREFRSTRRPFDVYATHKHNQQRLIMLLEPHGAAGTLVCVNFEHDIGRSKVHANPPVPQPAADVRARAWWGRAKDRPFSWSELPALNVPGVRSVGHTGTRSELGFGSMEASVVSSVPPAVLESTIARQLRRRGWSLLAGNAGPLVAWSTWSTPRRGNWRGLLYALTWCSQQRQWLRLRMDELTPPGPFARWMAAQHFDRHRLRFVFGIPSFDRADVLLRRVESVLGPPGCQLADLAVLQALLDPPELLTQDLIDELGVDARQIVAAVENADNIGRHGSTHELMTHLIALAFDEAQRAGSLDIGPEHVLLALVRARSTSAGQILAAHGVTLARARDTIYRLLAPFRAGPFLMPFDFQELSLAARRVFEVAQQEQYQTRHVTLGSHHLLIALADGGDALPAQTLVESGLTAGKLRQALADICDTRDIFVSDPALGGDQYQLWSAARTHARQLHSARVGTEHLLLAALDDGAGLAGDVLAHLGTNANTIRALLMQRVGESPPNLSEA